MFFFFTFWFVVMGPVWVKSANIYKEKYFGKTQRMVTKSLMKKFYQRSLYLSGARELLFIFFFGCDISLGMDSSIWTLIMFSWLAYSLHWLCPLGKCITLLRLITKWLVHIALKCHTCSLLIFFFVPWRASFVRQWVTSCLILLIAYFNF